MNNLLNYLTKPQVARSYSPMFDLFNTLEESFTAPGSKEETYNRSFRIDGHDFNTEQLKAEITDGVLRINVPRVERKEQKVINVEVS